MFFPLLEQAFLSDPELEDKVPTSYLSHKEIYEEGIRKNGLVQKKIRKLEDEGKMGAYGGLKLCSGMTGTAICKEGFPTNTHFSMFVTGIEGHGTLEQRDRWLEKARSCEIIGTYAQTELGHGTFVRGLETTATYNPKTKEFILHSPTITAYKWWPGGSEFVKYFLNIANLMFNVFLVGHTANYAIVLAQLYTQGKCHGIQPFMVQLRDEKTHMPVI